jgi:hypothetical protein
VPGRISIDGFTYQAETGELIEIAEASAIGEVNRSVLRWSVL